MTGFFRVSAASSFRRSTALFFVFFILASSLVVLLELLGFNWHAALRDRQLSDEPLAGLISDIGIFLVAGAGLLGAWGALIGRQAPLAALSVFCLVFAADDRLMLHERLGRLEFLIYPLYAAVLAFVWRCYSFSLGTGVIWPLAIVFAAFVFSAVIDLVWDRLVVLPGFEYLFRYRGVGYALEDIPKFAGLSVLSVFTANEAVSTLRAGRRTGFSRPTG